MIILLFWVFSATNYPMDYGSFFEILFIFSILKFFMDNDMIILLFWMLSVLPICYPMN